MTKLDRSLLVQPELFPQFASALVLFSSLLCVNPANAAFTFNKIADTGDVAPGGVTFTQFGSPSVGGGTVAFAGSDGNLGAGSGIYTSTNGILTARVRGGSAIPGGGTFGNLFSAAPTINSSGTVAFYSDYTNGVARRGIFTSASGALTLVASNAPGPTSGVPGGGTFDFLNAPTISGDTVAFNANYTGGTGTVGNFTVSSTGGQFTTIVKGGAGGPLSAPGGTRFAIINPSTISGGNTAFSAIYNGGPDAGIFIGSGGTPGSGTGGTLTTVALFGTSIAGGGTINGGFSFADISGNTALFSAGIAGGPGTNGLFTGSGGVLTAVARNIANGVPGGGTFTAFRNSAISGDNIVFGANYDDGGSKTGIFASLSGVLVPVVRLGDSLFGSTVNGVQFASSGLDGDQIAFQYSLANGRTGIASTLLGTAVTVPEASTFALALPALGMIGTLVLRRQKK